MFIGLCSRSRRSIINFAATAPSMMVSPRRLKPFNRNDNFRLFNRSGKEPQAILVDHRGNVSILEIRPRRWKKTPVYQIP